MPRSKLPPSHYPFFPRLIVRCLQSFAAAYVAATMIYFIHTLLTDKRAYLIPKTFDLLLVTGLATEAFLFVTGILGCCFAISPLIYMLGNTLLFVLWTVAGSLLGWFASKTMVSACNADSWGREGEGGWHICRVYKSLFAFTFVAWFSTICSLYLDIHVRRKQTRLGAYSRMGDDAHKRGMPLAQDDPWSTELAPAPRGQPQYMDGGYGRVSESHEPAGYAPMSGAARGYGPIGEEHAPAAEHQPLNASATSQPSYEPPSYDTGYHGHQGDLFYEGGKR